MNLINKIFYNKQFNKKAWHIKGVETDPTQTDSNDNIIINDKMINLTITQEKDKSDIIATINVDNKEYSFLIYDEIINYVKKLKKN